MQTDYTHATVKHPIPGSKIAILQASWHEEHTNRMVEACAAILTSAKCDQVDHFKVPGSYELPLAAKRLAKLKRYDALVVVGAIVKGDTDHYKVILETCIREIGRVMYEFEIPIIMEILPVHKIEDLISRTQGFHNKGIEAAMAAIETIHWHRSIK